MLFGVLLMHSAPMSFASPAGIGEHTMTSTVSAPPVVSEHSAALSATAVESGSAAHCGNGCGDHSSVMHLCLAIVGAVAALAVLRAVVVALPVLSSTLRECRQFVIEPGTRRPGPFSLSPNCLCFGSDR
ncbi:hypothetical protein BJF84_24685 [Rhodococcus sp. CUA-806]|nr:hypothetical protein BJF84_24685 [Rhodococcus sp. CUA-806]